MLAPEEKVPITKAGAFAEGDLARVYDGILNACVEVANHMRYHTSNKIESWNESGD